MQARIGEGGTAMWNTVQNRLQHVGKLRHVWKCANENLYGRTNGNEE